MDYIVSHPAGARINGAHRERGFICTGADADAVSNSRILQHRCTPKRSSAPAVNAATPSAPALRAAYEKE
jgi:hypothetical protein